MTEIPFEAYIAIFHYEDLPDLDIIEEKEESIPESVLREWDILKEHYSQEEIIYILKELSRYPSQEEEPIISNPQSTTRREKNQDKLDYDLIKKLYDESDRRRGYVGEIAEKSGFKYQSVYYAINSMKKQGMLSS